MASKKGLGKGLDALFAENNEVVDENSVKMLKISEIEPNREQPRKLFDDEALTQLAESITEHGVLQPILVRAINTGGYQIIAGERRYRASRMAGLTEIPALIKDYDDTKTMEIALIENLQRQDLNPIEEAMGYNELMEKYGMTQAEVSKSVGKSRSAVANTLRLLSLPTEAITYLEKGKISQGHARTLLAVENKVELEQLLRKCSDDKMTVRELEREVKKLSSQPKPTEEPKPKQQTITGDKDKFFAEMELALKAELHRKVNITQNGDGGTIEITFYSKQELGDLAQRLANQKRW